MKVALISDALYKWDGGTDFLTNIAVVLNSINYEKIETVLFIPKASVFTKVVKHILLGKNNDDEIRKEKLVRLFQELGISVQIIYYSKMPRQPFIRDKGKSLDRAMAKEGIDVALPIMIEAYEHMNTPWIAYIPDLQEKYLPHLFSDREILERDGMYKYNVKMIQYYIATSENVKHDIMKYYGVAESQIFATPFAPIAPENFMHTKEISMTHYKLPSRYFVISNQFWAHKSHDTAFDALEILYNEGYRDIHLYCTGELKDYRGDGYVNTLKEKLQRLKCKDNIHIVGYIPKLEQVELIKRSVSLIQPSSFEGDCGGCSVYLARSLCVNSILADIPVNLEGKGDPYLYFYQHRDPADLARCMIELLEKEQTYPTSHMIRASNNSNIRILGDFYYQLLKSVICNFKK